ncbi:MAG: hypothetical protein IT196_05265 [Acidimicrobiales bacterium]|nr:hypothetical protein [Acidimicrobiales bacterium]
MDLLAAHRGDGDAPEVRLSSEITLIQRPTRFRSEVRRPARAYDAREIQLLDSGRSPHVRRAGALLLDLQESLMWKPGVEDAQGGSGVEELLTALEGHGIQRSIIRAPQILDAAAMVIVTLVNLPALVRIERADAEAFDADLPVRWRVALGVEGRPRVLDDADARNLMFQNMLHDQFPKVKHWFRNLPDMDLRVLRSPSGVSELEKVLATPAPTSQFEDRDAWVFDRFAVTFPTAWRSSSLRSEWRYLHGDLPSPCPRPLMASRPVQIADVAAAVADRYVKGDPPQVPDTVSTKSLVSPAVSMLESGDVVGAAAIFDACRRVTPGDPDAHNNYGFCVMTTDPAAAIDALERGAKLGYPERAIFQVNKTLCLHWLGRTDDAIRTLLRVLAEGTRAPGTCFLWSPCHLPSDAKLRSLSDFNAYVAELAAMLASHVGDDDLRRRLAAAIPLR